MNRYLTKLAASYPVIAEKLGLGKIPTVKDLPDKIGMKGVIIPLAPSYLGQLLRKKPRTTNTNVHSRFPKTMVKEW